MRDSSHNQLVDMAMCRAEALARHRRAMIRRNGIKVEKAEHFRQVAAILLFAVNVLVWGDLLIEVLK